MTQMASDTGASVGEYLDVIGWLKPPARPHPTIGVVTIYERPFGRRKVMVGKRDTGPVRQRPDGEEIWNSSEAN